MCRRQKETKRDGDSFVSSWASLRLRQRVMSSSWKQQSLRELLVVKRIVDIKETQKLSPYLPDSSQGKNMDDKQYEHQVLEFNTEYYIAYHIISDTKKKNPAS
ncbi:hypothetical protein llap_11746 [Limosa lapponica baueri]|uniref:Uncharacterized protein n=1 Tax=Limosa lapponica baueri TaxID=1758121 RepID=A0A2I0TVY3_LIMLA|nr:hypothetical protein llap_11746 [Limosa lapponica baueri]